MLSDYQEARAAQIGIGGGNKFTKLCKELALKRRFYGKSGLMPLIASCATRQNIVDKQIATKLGRHRDDLFVLRPAC